MNSLAAIDFGLRGGAVTMLGVLAVALLRDGRAAAAARWGAAFAVGVAAYVICSAPGFAPHLTGWGLPLLVLALGNSAVFWRFARALFDDDPGAFRRWLLGWLGMVGLGLLNQLWLHRLAGVGVLAGALFHLAALAWIVDAVRRTAAGWRADLVERRRRLRPAVVLGIALYATVIVIGEIWLADGPVPAETRLLNAAGLLALALALGLPLLALRGEGLFVAAATVRPEPAVEPADGTEAPLLAALRRAMAVERAYREDTLTVAGLAARLGVTEHRLRRLINQSQGHRNFNAFVNGYRLAEAKAALADPAQAGVPILTIALDAGFGSIGPFNRAFKADTGMTPSEYRERSGQR